eukprot:COSAG01_NODE_578_length_15259_cov_10.160950_3_plen_95_part_00
MTEIYLCDVCSRQEILRRNGRGQAEVVAGVLDLAVRTLAQPVEEEAEAGSSSGHGLGGSYETDDEALAERRKLVRQRDERIAAVLVSATVAPLN